MPYNFRFGGRTPPPPAPRWPSSPEANRVTALEGLFARGEATVQFTAVVNGTQAVSVSLNRSFPGESFVPVATIARASGVFGTVTIRETRVTGPSSVEVILQSAAILTNKSVTIKVVGIAC